MFSSARILVRSILLTIAFIATTACQGPGGGYLSNGIGSDLPARDIETATRLQTKYFDHLCRQAGLGGDAEGKGCFLPTVDENRWTLIVKAGMNDIDRRCDAYLEWLDDAKRSKTPLLNQASAVQATTAAIIQFTSPGSAAIAIVAQAFGLLTQSIENYHSRLLLEIETSTVNSIVLRARHDFRDQTRDFRYSNRPDAEYALRSYIRLCLPFAIETNINDYSTLGSRGEAVTQGGSINSVPVIGRVLRSDTPDTAFTVVRRTQRPVTESESGPNIGVRFDTAAQGRFEQNYSKEGVQDLQNKLCIGQSGIFDDVTRVAIRIVEAEIGSQRINGIIDTGTEDDVISDAPRGCSNLPTGARNLYEKFHFQGSDAASPAAQIKGFQNAMAFCVQVTEQARPFENKPDLARLATGQLDEPTRTVIRYLAAGIDGAEGRAASATGLLSPDVLQRLRNCTL